MTELENFKVFNYTFKDHTLLQTALTHKSFHNENLRKSHGHNEMLEFLGDAVLDLALTDQLMKTFSDLDEGALSKIRASLVNESVLSEVAKEVGLEKQLLLGKGEIQSEGHLKPRLLSSVLEALIGAIYKDSDFSTIQKIIEELFSQRLSQLDLTIHFREDYKTRLQEKMQTKHKQTPKYELFKEEGPDHSKIFFVQLKMADQIIATGSGRSKKQAEQNAAQVALMELFETMTEV